MATCAQSGMAPHYWSASTEDKGEQRLSLSPASYLQWTSYYGTVWEL